MNRILFSGLWLLLLAASGVAQADIYSQCPPDTDGIDTDGDGIVDNDNVCLGLAAGDGFIRMGDLRGLYTFGFHNVTGVPDPLVMMEGMVAAEFPAPTIVVREGQHVYINLSNVGMLMRPDLFDPHSVHWHGFPNAASVFDGEPTASVSINMGETLTYFYNVVEPGTYMYHCHVEAAEHMQMGMLGNLYVLPRQNLLPDGTDLSGFTHHTGYTYAYNDGDGSTVYDVDYPVQIGTMDPVFHDLHLAVQPLPFANMHDTYAMFNGRGYPDTVNPAVLSNDSDLLMDAGLMPRDSQPVSSWITATVGQRILLRISSLSTTDFFTVTALGIPMQVIGRGARQLRGPTGTDTSYQTASVTVGGGETRDVLLDTAGLEPGTYFLYTTNLNFLSNDTEDFGGLMTEIELGAPIRGGGPPPARGNPLAQPAPAHQDPRTQRTERLITE